MLSHKEIKKINNLQQEQMFVRNAEWKLLDLAKKRESVTYSCCPDPYINLKFTMTLKRNSALYCSILLMPATGAYHYHLDVNSGIIALHTYICKHIHYNCIKNIIMF